jgi:hypothetical protein
MYGSAAGPFITAKGLVRITDDALRHFSRRTKLEILV